MLRITSRPCYDKTRGIVRTGSVGPLLCQLFPISIETWVVSLQDNPKGLVGAHHYITWVNSTIAWVTVTLHWSHHVQCTSLCCYLMHNCCDCVLWASVQTVRSCCRVSLVTAHYIYKLSLSSAMRHTITFTKTFHYQYIYLFIYRLNFLSAINPIQTRVRWNIHIQINITNKSLNVWCQKRFLFTLVSTFVILHLANVFSQSLQFQFLFTLITMFVIKL